MTPAQKFNFFMPAWNAAVKANGWHTRGGAAAGVDRVTCDELGKIITYARQMWMARGRMSDDGSRMVEGPTLRDLRHACTILCLGRDKATEALNNKEQDHIVSLFRLLANPMNIAARTAFDAYQRGENPGGKVRRKYFIKSRAPEAELSRLLAQRGIYGHRPAVQQKETKPEVRPAAPVANKQNPKHYVLKPELVYTKGPF